MKKGLRNMLVGLALAIIASLGLVAFVRLAPSDAAQWNTPVTLPQGAASGVVVPMTGAAALWLGPDQGAPLDVLTRLDAIAMATPRTERLTGSVADGRITWITRSALWGFPDYTTAEIRDGGVAVLARLRFGREDMGVNAARLARWQGALAQ